RTALGELLRTATEEDERAADRGRSLGRRVFEDARRLALELSLPLEILDVEVLLDGQRAIVHHLRTVECDYRSLVSALSRQHDVLISMENLALPAPVGASGGCGKPDCGKEGGGGGCTDCGSGGGCSSGS